MEKTRGCKVANPSAREEEEIHTPVGKKDGAGGGGCKDVGV